MTFRQRIIVLAARVALVTGAALAPVVAPVLAPSVAWAGAGVAIVPERTVYPGEKLTREMLRAVEVINPNLAPGYASSIAQIAGLVTTRTLLPGRTIPVRALREAWAVERGSAVKLVFAHAGLVITAQGTPLNNAAIGELVRVRNIETGVIVSGTVMNDGTIRVMKK